MNLTIVSLSASERSVSRSCISPVKVRWTSAGHQVSSVDVRSLTPVWVNDAKLSALPPEYLEVDTVLRESDGVALFWPVYCYSAGSAAKAFTEIFGGAFEKMPVAMVAAAGSLRSHLAVGQLMQSMMFEQETLCYPKAVMATKSELLDGHPNPELTERLHDFADGFALYAEALKSFRSAVPAAR